jgi:hypothetical protein
MVPRREPLRRSTLLLLLAGLTLALLDPALPERLEAQSVAQAGTAIGADDPVGVRPIATTRIEPRERLPEGAATLRGGLTRDRHPAALHIPVDRATFRALKAEARATPSAEPADAILGIPTRPEPLPGPTFDRAAPGSFAGLDYFSASSASAVPDPTLAKGPRRLLAAANSALRLMAPDGSGPQTVDLDAFFGAPPGTFIYSPRAFFDRNAANQRFYVVASEPHLGVPSQPESYLHLAVSRSDNPADLGPESWCRYRIDARSDVGTGDLGWADHSNLGLGADTLLVSTNQYRFSDNAFAWAYVRALDKLALADNALRCPAVDVSTFVPATTLGDWSVFNLQPVQHMTSPSSARGASNPAYLVSHRYVSSNLYRVWRVRNLASGSPLLDSVEVGGSFTYSFPPDAPQAGTSSELDTGDTRIQQAAGLADALWAAHGTGCAVGGGDNEACVRVVRILVGQDPGGKLGARLAFETTFAGGEGVFFWWPGIAVNEAEEVAVAFESSSARTFLSAWYSLRDPASPGFAAATPIAHGTCPLGGGSGDYVGAQTDPADFTRFWLAGERHTVVDGFCTWQTWIVAVKP